MFTSGKTATVGQYVEGKVCGAFVVVGERTIDGEEYLQLKTISLATMKAGRGEIALSRHDLR